MKDEDRERIRAVAERLRASGTRVTSRAVYDELGRKGSYNAMAAVVADWRAEVDYRPEIEHHDLPVALKVRLLGIGAEILGHVRAEQAAALDVERANAEARRRAYEMETAEATALVGQLLERVRDLQHEVAHLRALTAVADDAVPETVEPAAQASPVAATDEVDRLWRRIAGEVRALLDERGPMWEPDILEALTPQTRQRSIQAGLPLSAGWLGFHLRRMAEAGEGIRIADGRFAPVEAEGAPEEHPGRNVEATRFWRLVMLEIVAIIRRAGRPMTAAEIMEELAPNTQATAQRFDELKPGVLAEKMRVRAERKNAPYFLDLKDGRFDLGESMKKVAPNP